jgi:uncharacterized protein YbjT (DUF2867 family)
VSELCSLTPTKPKYIRFYYVFMNNLKETVLVTEATGTVGSEVVKHLAALSLSSDYIVKAAIHSKNKSDQLRQFENKGVEIVDLDLTKQETVAHALNNVDRVFIQTLPVPNVADIIPI